MFKSPAESEPDAGAAAAGAPTSARSSRARPLDQQMIRHYTHAQCVLRASRISAAHVAGWCLSFESAGSGAGRLEIETHSLLQIDLDARRSSGKVPSSLQAAAASQQTMCKTNRGGPLHAHC